MEDPLPLERYFHQVSGTEDWFFYKISMALNYPLYAEVVVNDHTCLAKLKRLLDQGHSPDEGPPDRQLPNLYRVIMLQKPKTAMMLVQHGCQVTMPRETEQSYFPVIVLAARYKMTALVLSLCLDRSVDIFVKDRDMSTIVHEAVSTKNYVLLTFLPLICRSCPKKFLTMRNGKGLTPLHLAVDMHGDLELLKLLLDFDDDCDLETASDLLQLGSLLCSHKASSTLSAKSRTVHPRVSIDDMRVQLERHSDKNKKRERDQGREAESDAKKSADGDVFSLREKRADETGCVSAEKAVLADWRHQGKFGKHMSEPLIIRALTEEVCGETTEIEKGADRSELGLARPVFQRKTADHVFGSDTKMKTCVSKTSEAEESKKVTEGDVSHLEREVQVLALDDNDDRNLKSHEEDGAQVEEKEKLDDKLCAKCYSEEKLCRKCDTEENDGKKVRRVSQGRESEEDEEREMKHCRAKRHSIDVSEIGHQKVATFFISDSEGDIQSSFCDSLEIETTAREDFPSLSTSILCSSGVNVERTELGERRLSAEHIELVAVRADRRDSFTHKNLIKKAAESEMVPELVRRKSVTQGKAATFFISYSDDYLQLQDSEELLEENAVAAEAVPEQRHICTLQGNKTGASCCYSSIQETGGRTGASSSHSKSSGVESKKEEKEEKDEEEDESLDIDEDYFYVSPNRRMLINQRVMGSKETLLHFAARGCHLKVIKFLLCRGAEVNARDLMNNTPLHMLVMERNESDKGSEHQFHSV
jgi:ankyrin repeat protein